MNITPQQAHAAFYQAAENIERNPGLYDFSEVFVGKDCPACLWGHVGRVLGFPEGSEISEVVRAVGRRDHGEIFYDSFHHPETSEYTHNHLQAAARLRAFADHHWPQPIITHTPSEYSFSELMEQMEAAA